MFALLLLTLPVVLTLRTLFEFEGLGERTFQLLTHIFIAFHIGLTPISEHCLNFCRDFYPILHTATFNTKYSVRNIHHTQKRICRSKSLSLILLTNGVISTVFYIDRISHIRIIADLNGGIYDFARNTPTIMLRKVFLIRAYLNGVCSEFVRFGDNQQLTFSSFRLYYRHISLLTPLTGRFLILDDTTSRGNPNTAARIAGADIACRIDTTHIVRVRGVGRTKPPILRSTISILNSVGICSRSCRS